MARFRGAPGATLPRRTACGTGSQRDHPPRPAGALLSAYFDTGIITKWYVPESNSRAALALRARWKPPCPLTHLHRLELLNAWHLKVFRGEVTGDAVAGAIEDLNDDVEAGVWSPPGYVLASVFVTAERLVRHHTAAIGVRSLDVFHVAAALELKAADFVTGDDRQARCARAAGLRVTFL